MNYKEDKRDHGDTAYWKIISEIFQTGKPRQGAARPREIPGAHCLAKNEFVSQILRALYRADRAKTTLALILLHVDIHSSKRDLPTSGDNTHYWQLTASRIRNCLRKHDVLMHSEAGNFALLLEDVTDVHTIPCVFDKIVSSLALPFTRHDNTLIATAHAGASLSPQDGTSVQALWDAASSALHRASHQQPGTMEFANHAMNTRTRERNDLYKTLHKAQQRQEFQLVYQPILDTRTRQVTRVEALLRWQHPRRGTLEPASFMYLLEDTGLILPVGYWVLETAFAQAYRMRCAGHRHLRFSVNLSARQFLDPALPNLLTTLLQRAGYTPDLVELECPEKMLMQEFRESRRILRSLAAIGIPVTVDNFNGTSSGLAELLRLPLAGLKINRELIQRMLNDSTYSAIVRGIIVLGNGTHIPATATGVENEEQLEFLSNNHCRSSQGNLFARPMPASELAHWLPN